MKMANIEIISTKSKCLKKNDQSTLIIYKNKSKINIPNEKGTNSERKTLI